MGESGAGKTTLLNVLSQRVDMGTITGDFLVNGAKLDTSFRRSTGYVQQQDLHVAELTVRESLQFAARLRRAKSVPDSEKLDYVEKIIAILSMESYAEAIIGESGAGLNVEQRKKLSIGVELVAKPSLLLFLDEPTSGLDSQSAWAIVNLLQKLAAAGQSILCTIHQPSATLFEAFDRLLLLKKGGQTVYFGDIGKNSKIILDYFERNGARPCTPSENPAEYILESIGAGATASIKEDWFEIWKKSEEYRDTTQEVEKIKYIQNNEEDGLTDAERKALHDTYAMPYFDQLRYVTRRTRTQLFRSPQYIISKFMLYLSGGLFIGFTFWNIEPTIIGMQNGMFAVFLSIIISVPAINQIQERAVASRELFEVRESKSNTFHWSTLLIAQFVNEIPYHLLVGAIYFVCLYFPMKINNAASRSAVWYLNYAIMYQLYTISFGLMIVYFSPDLASAAVITGLFVSFMISFCGVVQPLSLMPQFWTFMYKVSPLTYIIQTLMALVLHNKAVVCGEDEYSFFNPPQGMTCSEYAQPFIDETQRGYLKNPEATSNCGYCQYSVADEYMATVNVKYSYRWRNFGFMWVYIMFNLAAMCGLYYFFRIGNINLFAPIQNLIERFQGKKEAKKEETPAI
jgi:ATP-binding cassette subfamily G (WHITE) protein 2 (SNQ2)